MEVNLTLPYPPSVNHYWGEAVQWSKKRKRHVVVKFLTKEAKDYRATVDEHVWEQLGRAPLFRQRLSVIIKQYYGAKQPGGRLAGQAQDIDNCLKPLLDAMEHAGVYRNDNQIDALLVVRKRRAAVGRVEVTVKTEQ